MTRDTETASREGFERAGSQDETPLVDLARRAYEVFIPVMNAVPAPMTADYGALIREAEVWVQRGEAGHLGASLVLVPQDAYLLIDSIAVDPVRQGEGLGRQLLVMAQDRAREMGYGEVRLYTNVLMKANRAWYKRSGFEETGEEQRGDKRIVHLRRMLAG